MNSRNLNYDYYVAYFEKLDLLHPDQDQCGSELKKRNQKLTEYDARSCDLMISLPEKLASDTMELQTVYPGLLIGAGIAHGFGGKGEAALGLSLDYVTGMPYIPGASVKGALRSAFAHSDYIKELLKDEHVTELDSLDIDELTARIFGNPIKGKRYSVSPKEQDTFFDAIVVSEGKLLATDSITPHRQNTELLELASPNPLTMIRIRPGVTFRFQFHLKETLGITPQQKLNIFRQIMLDLGIGAKRNVGYGVLHESQTGICEICGKPTKQNTKTGKFYPICGTCRFKKKK